MNIVLTELLNATRFFIVPAFAYPISRINVLPECINSINVAMVQVEDRIET